MRLVTVTVMRTIRVTATECEGRECVRYPRKLPEPEQVKAFAYRLMLLHWHALAFQANATASRSGLAYYSLTLILAYSNIMIFLPAHIRAR